MYSIYTARKKEEEELRKQHAASLDRAIHSSAHRSLTATLSRSHRARVEEWMSSTLAADVPPLPPKPLSMADLATQPYKFYRTRSPPRGHAGSQSARTRKSRGTWDSTADEDTMPQHVQMSPLKWQSEKDRLAEYERSDAHLHLVGKEPYEDPQTYIFRRRDRAAEVAGPFVYRPQNERARIEEAITARDVGGRAFPWEEPKLYPDFRTEDQSKWRAGLFSARLPTLPVFSTPARVEEPYTDRGSSSGAFVRASSPSALSSSRVHTRRFTSQVPSDRVVALPAGHPRSPRPPVGEFGGGHALGGGLTATGLYGDEESGKREQHAKTHRAHWKQAIQLAHGPTPSETDTAQQLVKTYRKHLAY